MLSPHEIQVLCLSVFADLVIILNTGDYKKLGKSSKKLRMNSDSLISKITKNKLGGMTHVCHPYYSGG
jgi:hypothetical protein